MAACIDFFEMSEICRPKFIVRHSTTVNWFRIYLIIEDKKNKIFYKVDRASLIFV
jgi:hypothetical protein